METSIRYGGNSKAIRFHAKQKLSLGDFTLIQARGELDTKSGAPSHLSAMIRHFYPDISASLGVGLQYDKRDKLRYHFRGKKAFPVTDNGLVCFNIKGQCDVDKEFREVFGDNLSLEKISEGTFRKFNFKKKSTGSAEFTWGILNFQKNQDLRLKIGVEVFDQLPFVQIRENNWTFNVDSNGRWNVRYNL